MQTHLGFSAPGESDTILFMKVGERSGWRWAAVAVLLALLVLGLGFILRSAGLGAAANAAQLVALAPLIVGLIAWARSRRGLHQEAAEKTITFGEFLRTIADAQGLTSRDLYARMRAWDAEAIDVYMDGNRIPTWEFVTNLLDVVAGDDPWRRETLERRERGPFGKRPLDTSHRILARLRSQRVAPSNCRQVASGSRWSGRSLRLGRC